MSNSDTALPARFDTTIFKNATFNPTFLWRDEAEQPIDNSLYSAKFVAAATVGGTPVITKTSGAGITMGGTNGEISLLLSSTETAAISQSQLHYSLTVTLAGVVTPLAVGNLAISSEVFS